MFNRLEDFRTTWQEEVEDTLKVLRAIPDQALDQAVAPGHRDLRRLGWHLVGSIGSLTSQMGLRVDGPAQDERGFPVAPPPARAPAIADAYARSAESLLEALADWDDAELEKVDLIFGHLHWKRSQTLLALLVHQVHHRGQMTVLMRQAGILVPEFYGPTREGWAAMGMPAPAV
ncbi:DinB family protein [Geothrix mesophila]|uniref:DinB family protein n=1 Tax=Geothrix mesophila TaxID=2922723 RepID=UPI001FAB8502|nr:DinB family protein [Geothrix sp. SG198]